MTEFAAQVFGVPFDPAAVIGEERINLANFLPDSPTLDTRPADLDALREQTGESYDAYIQRQIHLWFGDQSLTKTELAAHLKQHSLLHTLLTATQDEILPWPEIINRLARFDPTLTDHPNPNLLLQSLLALIAHARVDNSNQLPVTS